MSVILTHLEAGVLTITLNRLDKKNAFTEAMYTAAAETVEAASRAADVRVLLIQGHETVFSAGNDIADFIDHPPSGTDAPVYRFLLALIDCPKPVIASVCGPAVGIGTTMLLHCDLVYAGDNAAFALPFVNLGLCPEAGASLLLPQLMGQHRAAEALLLGEPFMAEAALEVGLVNRIVPPTEANALAQNQARKLALKPADALRTTKRLLRQVHADALRAQLAVEAQEFVRLVNAPAAREAFAAFVEKRRPDFAGL